ncbi:MAG: right-handed parallel beta-helix repeat-containing protein [Myxococcales bacterium]|nr:hypothetical protein [Myxococcales bacterium]
MMRQIVRRLTLTLLAIGLASPALAVDGVLEINQTCAVNTGCFNLDAAGFPVTIDGSAGRSYRLTSDLVIPDSVAATTNAIFVSGPSISIDLNGFEIVRSGCEGSNTNCMSTTVAGCGVCSFNNTRGISVKNGSIVGMGSGIGLGTQCEVRNVRARWNRFNGVSCDIGSSMSNNVAYQNGADGVRAEDGSTISGNTSYLNGNNGIFAGFGSTVSGNAVWDSVFNGIFCQGECTISGNTSNRSGGDGIFANNGSSVTGNTVRFGAADGIQTGTDSNVQGNTVSRNTLFGLNLGTNSAYRGNVISLNSSGTVSGGVNLGANSCNGTATCP